MGKSLWKNMIAVLISLIIVPLSIPASVYADNTDAEECSLRIESYYESLEGEIVSEAKVSNYKLGDTFTVSGENKPGYSYTIDGASVNSVTGIMDGDKTVYIVYYGETRPYQIVKTIEQTDGSYKVEYVDYEGKVGQITEAEIDKNLIEEGYHASEPVNLKIPADGVLKIDVLYLRNEFEVSFDTNGGSYIDPVYGKYGDIIKPYDYITEKEGYTFEGWYKDSDCTVQAEEIEKPNNDVKYYAKWTEEETIEENVKPEFGTPVYTYSKTRGGTYTSTKPTKAGRYYVKVTVPSTNSDQGFEFIKEITIYPKDFFVNDCEEPKTSDSSNLLFPTVILITAGAALAAVIVNRKKHK